MCPPHIGKFDDDEQWGLPVAFNGSDGAPTYDIATAILRDALLGKLSILFA